MKDAVHVLGQIESLRSVWLRSLLAGLRENYILSSLEALPPDIIGLSTYYVSSECCTIWELGACYSLWLRSSVLSSWSSEHTNLMSNQVYSLSEQKLTACVILQGTSYRKPKITCWINGKAYALSSGQILLAWMLGALTFLVIHRTTS